MPLPRPVIVVPGVTATQLRDMYPLPPETVWALLTKAYDRVALHPENLLYEATLPAQVRPDQLLEIAYKEMILDLRHDLTQNADQPVPVYTFGYDWRQPLEKAQADLAVFIDEVIERTRLMRHYRNDGYEDDRKVSLIGHSMGGMIIAGHLASRGAAARVGRVATVVTPFRGSLEAVEKLITGTTASREREAARLTPSLYYLLPSFTQGIEIAPTLPQTDLFDPALWQNSITASIQEALRLQGSGAIPANPANAEAILDAMLMGAKLHRNTIETLDPSACGLSQADWLCVVGVNEKTRVALAIADGGSAGPRFDLSDAMVDNQWGGDPKLAWRTGDGTVPYDGAQPGFPATMVELGPQDFGLLELKDKALTLIGGLHGIIPNMNRLQKLLVAHLS